MPRRYSLVLTCALWMLNCSGVEVQFPEPRVSTILVEGAWRAAPIVAIGEVLNVTSYGEQSDVQLPPPTSPEVHRLFWCVGDFQVIAVVKGKLSNPVRKYLWASTTPGCALWPADPRLIHQRFRTRAWLLREEGDFLRPAFDYIAPKFLGLFAKWDDGPRLPAPRRLGVMLLLPSASSDSPEEYAEHLWNIGGIACELLGRAECSRRIRDLTEAQNARLAESACNFLNGQLKGNCAPSHPGR